MSVCDAQMLSFQHQQKGVSPRMLKALVSRGHPEFSSNRQQDAHEFLQHMVNLVEVSGASVHVRHIRNVHRLVWRDIAHEYKVAVCRCSPDGLSAGLQLIH